MKNNFNLPIIRTPSQLSTRSSSAAAHAGPSDPLAIRGAARPTAAGRLRRGAVSSGSATNGTVGRATVNRTKAVEHWRELVKSRYNAEAQFLNLEVSHVLLCHG